MFSYSACSSQHASHLTVVIARSAATRQSMARTCAAWVLWIATSGFALLAMTGLGVVHVFLQRVLQPTRKPPLRRHCEKRSDAAIHGANMRSMGAVDCRVGPCPPRNDGVGGGRFCRLTF